MRRHMLPTLFAVLALVGAACGEETLVDLADGGPSMSTTSTTTTQLDLGSSPARLAVARAQWADSAPATYVLTLRELCFCPETVWTETIADGVVVSHEPSTAEAAYDPGPRTMEDLFDEVQGAIDAGYATIELEVDPETGALVSYWVDVDEMTADEEYGVEVVSLTVGDEGLKPTVGIDAAVLVEDHPCGFGFAIGSTDQSLGLFLHTSGGVEPDLAVPIELPDGDWTAELHVGRDLFSNHCADLVEIGEPEPVVADTWTVVAGTLTIDAVSNPAGGGGASAAGILTSAVLESADGHRIELDDIELRNDCWGCLAG